MSLIMKDYRESHTAPGYGNRYQEKFKNNPYRAMMWKIEKKFLDDIYKKYFTRKELVHFDFACGTGRILNFYEKKAKKSVGVDISQSMLDVAKINNEKSIIIQADLTKHDVLGDTMFNLISAFRFFPNAQQQLRIDTMIILKKHLDKDGYIIFNNHKNLTSTRLRLARILGRNEIHGMHHSEVENILSKVGLSIVSTYHAGVFPSSSHRQILSPFLLNIIETFTSRFDSLKFFAENIIYVCAHAPENK